MGKTISVTLPLPLEQKLGETAKKVGMSRSRFICNILLKWEEKVKQVRRPKKAQSKVNLDLNVVPNDCPNREDDGFCRVFDIICNAPQNEANTCVGYPKRENKGE